MTALVATSALTAAGTVQASTAPAAATAQPAPVTGFGSNPGNLTMYRYAPPGLGSGSPAVVLLHGCGQGGPEYFTHAGWQKFADAHGFSVIVAEQKQANNSSRCFNWFESGDISRGQGEALSVKQMVDRTVADLAADPDRIFVTGLSAGGIMAASLLAAYPEVFASGAVVAGLPHRCASGMLDAFTCMSPGRTQSAQAWGDLVRAAHPGHSGERPTVQLWHGGADHVVASANLQESVKQWTNAHGTNQTPNATGQLPADTTRTEYHDAGGKPVVISYRTASNGHGTPVAPGSGATQCGQAGAYFLASLCSSYYIVQDWGLAGSGGSDPDPTDPGPDPDPDPDPTDPPATCHTGSNYAHTQAGRATQRGGWTYAVGSGDALGLWNMWVTTTLAESPPGYYRLAPGAC
ncbi:PHB depolymerase family esterase [Streptomyces sp. ACA25]|uniref:extracellular catalytic domain type 1 short-chain-length polyhydroxyalkanoate depolymerase n=1 Tax=Streptomyces sp. ACA25 TaxID=3022596 RepID=UPI002307EB7D|nr:PHB depolymerase family esterase [Streptomyces sp. ACA25]MDB1087997.1 PHB depolymerase family esterase [Streptomyces sp. ACA25]